MKQLVLLGSLVMTLSGLGIGCKEETGSPEPGSASAGAGGAASADGAGQAGSAEVDCEFAAAGSGPAEVRAPWDWIGVVGTGQSLAVGEQGFPIRSTTQPYNNLQLSTAELPWPIDPADDALEMVPLIEPIGRTATGYPSSWPTNISRETIHSSMANQVTALVMAVADQDYVGVHGQFGENGQCMSYLQKGATEGAVNGRAFSATLVATEAVARLAEAEGKSYGIGAITVIHGECDAGNTDYEADLVQLWSDYNSDLSAVTGQSERIQMLVSQQNSTNNRAASTLAQWRVGVNHPEDIVCVGPNYPYPSGDGTHLTGDGYRKLGEKFGQVYFERVVMGRDWHPLQPLGIEKEGDRVLNVKFHVPAPPLVWDEAMTAPHQSSAAWASGKGFEVRLPSGPENLTIESVEIVCDTVRITMESDLPEADIAVSYALYADPEARSAPDPGMHRWGLLRDSDATLGRGTEESLSNFALAFEILVPSE